MTTSSSGWNRSSSQWEKHGTTTTSSPISPGTSESMIDSPRAGPPRSGSSTSHQVPLPPSRLPDTRRVTEAGHFQIPEEWIPPLVSQIVAFRHDPAGSPLKTPSGRIELLSETIEGFGYDDCPPHPSWLEPAEWLGNAGSHPLHMISNQPKTRLHSQWDHGETSLKGKIDGREQFGISPADAGRGLQGGELVRSSTSGGVSRRGDRSDPT